MSKLDQAFIKAFHRHERELWVGIEDASIASANSDDGSSDHDVTSSPPQESDAEAIATSASTEVVSDEERALWADSLASAATELSATETPTPETQAEGEDLAAPESKPEVQQLPVLELAEEIDDAVPEIALELVPEPGFEDEAAAPGEEPRQAEPEHAQRADSSGEETWVPATMVDGFTWSDETTQLGQVAIHPLDALADELLVGMTLERRVVAVAGTESRCGCTTVAMCAARRLAARGITTALCDADRVNHALASRLGCQPTTGWEDALEGQVSLPEALIGAKQESVVLLPLLGQALESASNWSGVADHLRLLRDHYDFVLLDLGAFSATAWTAEFAEALGVIDGVIVVDDIRDSSQGRYSEVHRQICQVGLTPVGVVENFVRDGAPERCTNPIGS